MKEECDGKQTARNNFLHARLRSWPRGDRPLAPCVDHSFDMALFSVLVTANYPRSAICTQLNVVELRRVFAHQLPHRLRFKPFALGYRFNGMRKFAVAVVVIRCKDQAVFSHELHDERQSSFVWFE